MTSDLKRQRRETDEEMDAEEATWRLMQRLKGRGHMPRKPPGAGSGNDVFSPQTPEGMRPSPHLGFGLLSSRTKNRFLLF